MTRGGRPGDAARQFEQELREVVARFDPVPEVVKSRARDAGLLQAPEGSELLDLAYDSVLDADIALMPGEAPLRLLAFSGGGVRLETKVETRSGRVTRLTAWVVPVAATAAALCTEDDIVDMGLDATGSFSTCDLTGGQVRVLIEVPLHGTVRTFHSSWFAL